MTTHNPNSRSITFRIDDLGDLVVSVVDSGPLVEQIWGDSDYEFWYRVPADRLQALANRLGCNSNDLLNEIRSKWMGSTFIHFQEILRSPDVEAKFHNY